MSSENIRKSETLSNLDDERSANGNKHQQLVSSIHHTKHQVIMPTSIMEGLQNQISANYLATTSRPVNVFVVGEISFLIYSKLLILENLVSRHF